MKDLEKMYKAGTRIIHYANGHRTELKILSTGLVVEYPWQQTKSTAIGRLPCSKNVSHETPPDWRNWRINNELYTN